MVRRKVKQTQCPDCGGEGFLEREHGLLQAPCNNCKGTGVITKEVVGGKHPKSTTRRRAKQANRST